MTEHLIKHIDRLMETRPLAKQALGSYRELLKLMMEVKPQPLKVILEDRLRNIKAEEGFPLYSAENLPIDYEASSKLLALILAHLSNSKRDDKDGLKKAMEHLRRDAEWADGLLKAGLKKDDTDLSKIALEVGLDSMTLLFLTRVALKPSLGALRNA